MIIHTIKNAFHSFLQGVEDAVKEDSFGPRPRVTTSSLWGSHIQSFAAHHVPNPQDLTLHMTPLHISQRLLTLSLAHLLLLTVVHPVIAQNKPDTSTRTPASEAEAPPTSPEEILNQIDLGGFLDTRVVTATRRDQDLIDAPASVVVITAQQMKDRGYNNLAEVIQDLPGFDVSLVNGTQYMLAYQRGYRTPWTQRTLLMIDGKVDNNLWSHQAAISRQYPISNIARIEVLYGPAAAVYGPNAFLGVINVITKDARGLTQDGVRTHIDLLAGSWNSRGVDGNVLGKYGDLSFSITGRLFRSDEADLSGQGVWLENDTYSSDTIWGPLIPHGSPNDPDYNPGIQNAGVPHGQYFDPTDDHAYEVKLNYKNLQFGIMSWRRKEAYGPYYAADHVQNNAFWTLTSRQVWAEHNHAFNTNLSLTTFLSWRESDIMGNWTEATPDWQEGQEEYSYVSHTSWLSDNDATLFKQDLNWTLSDHVDVSGGLKYERKDLTRAYAINGYWGVYSASADPNGGPEGYGEAIYHSSSDTYETPAETPSVMPDDNKILTDDIGGYVQTTVNLPAWTFNAGLRHDINSLYGSSTNPRLAAIFKWSKYVKGIDAAALKLLYGRAFQEPAPVQLFGGWQGRNANPLLQPETVNNFELNHLLRLGNFRSDISAYYAMYNNVIAEAALNTGQRRVVGTELKLSHDIPNLMRSSNDINVYAHYSFTHSQSSWRYHFGSSNWQDAGRWIELGDIAPHKAHAGINLPVTDLLHVNINGRWIASRTPYLANALRDPDREHGVRKLDAYTHVNAITQLKFKPAVLGLQIQNLLDARYFHPGAESASAGDDTSATRAQGFQNSLVPVPGRSFWVTLKLNMDAFK